MIQKVNFSQERLNNSHRVLSELVKKGVVVRFKHDWNKGMDYMKCKKFKIFFDSFQSIQADADLNRRFKRSNPIYDQYELEEIVAKTFHILKMFNEDDYMEIFEMYIQYIQHYL